jgi:hypothetical protein
VRPVAGSVPDRILAILGGAMVLGALIVLLRGGPEDASAPTTPPPPIQLLAPAPGTAVAGPFAISFRVENATLALTPNGWGIPGMHLHIEVDGTSFMPAASDVAAQSDGSYRWTFPALDPGPHTIRLYWSDMNHAAIPGGGSPPLKITAG